MTITKEKQAELATIIEENRAEIIDLAYKQYYKSQLGTQQMRYYVYIDPETGLPRSYHHYGNSFYPKPLWENMALLIVEYIADGTAVEEGGNFFNDIKHYLELEGKLTEFEEWKNSDEYKETTSNWTWDETDVEDYQLEWIKSNTKSYKAYCDDVIKAQFVEQEKQRIEDYLDELLDGLRNGTFF